MYTGAEKNIDTPGDKTQLKKLIYHRDSNDNKVNTDENHRQQYGRNHILDRPFVLFSCDFSFILCKLDLVSYR